MSKTILLEDGLIKSILVLNRSLNNLSSGNISVTPDAVFVYYIPAYFCTFFIK